MKGHKAFLGAILGGASAFGWLFVDLILPEPYGDFLLFGLLGFVNMIIGWQLGKLLDKTTQKHTVPVTSKETLHEKTTVE